MQTSEQLAEIAKALSKAQGAIKNAIKDSTNPHFKSRYADLASVWDAIREPLTNNGLSIVQGLSTIENKVTCTTLLLHESGQWIKDVMSMIPQQNTPQGQGSCATYLRRYMVMAMAGVAPDDDDGNEASKKGNHNENNFIKKNSLVEIPLVKAAPAPVAVAPAGPETFSSAPHQLRVVAAFLTSKNQLKSIDAICAALNGKEFTRANLAAAWDAINPEAPDKAPEGL